MTKPSNVTGQTIFRIAEGNRAYTKISNRLLQDRRISHETKGLLCELLSMPEDWEVTVRQLVAAGPSGRDRVLRMLKEAEQYGYVKPGPQRRNEKGTFDTSTYVVTDSVWPEEAQNYPPATDQMAATAFSGRGFSASGKPETPKVATRPQPAIQATDKVVPELGLTAAKPVDNGVALSPQPEKPLTAKPLTAQPATAEPYTANPKESFPHTPFKETTNSETNVSGASASSGALRVGAGVGNPAAEPKPEPAPPAPAAVPAQPAPPDPSPQAVAIRELVWKVGLAWLRPVAGIDEEKLRVRVGKWAKLYGEGHVLNAFHLAQKNQPIDVMTYIDGILAQTASGRPANSYGGHRGDDPRERAKRQLEKI